MNCRSFHRNYMILLDPGEDAAKVSDLEGHKASCPECARFYEEMSQTYQSVRPLKIAATPNFKQRVLKGAMVMQSQNANQNTKHFHSRIFWKSALAAAALVAVAIFVTMLGLPARFTTPAYAIEQTVEANKGVRSIHILCETSETMTKEFWMEFGEDGNLLRLRMSLPITEDGPKEIVWQEGKAEVWFKGKRSCFIGAENNPQEKFKDLIALSDPRQLMENLYQREAKGEVQITITQPSEPGNPIILTVKSISAPDDRPTYLVDPNTYLVMELDTNKARIKYLDYNKPIDPAVFTLNPPEDVMRVDQTTQEIGLAKGDLTNQEIATKVAREFFEALIAKDYAKAGKLMEGVPEQKMKETFGTVTFLRVVSIGDPQPCPERGPQAVKIPCEIELENAGNKGTQTFNPSIRPIENTPDRWDICGGV